MERKENSREVVSDLIKGIERELLLGLFAKQEKVTTCSFLYVLTNILVDIVEGKEYSDIELLKRVFEDVVGFDVNKLNI